MISPSPFPPNQARFIILLIAIAGLIGPLTSNIYYPALIDIGASLETSEALVNATVSVYIFFYGLMPMVWASFSDIYGRRTIYLLSTCMYVIASILCALASNIWMLMIVRALQATGSSSVIAVGAGTISDVYEVENRGTAMGIFFLGPLIGPLIGPVAGGFLNQYLGWRSIFWSLSIVGALITLTMVLWLPETLPRLRMKQEIKDQMKQEESAIELSAITTSSDYHEQLAQQQAPRMAWSQLCRLPFTPLILFTHPGATLSFLHVAMVFACMYIIITTIPRTFFTLYGLSSSQIGLTYIAFSLGTVVGSLAGGKFTDMVIKWKEAPVTEHRLSSAILGGLLTPLAILLYGWSVHFTLSLWLVLFSIFLTGIGIMFVATGGSAYVVDSFPGKSASAISAGNFARSLFGTIGTAVAVPMLDALESGPSFTLLAILVLLSTLATIVVFVKGQVWHQLWISKHTSLFTLHHE